MYLTFTGEAFHAYRCKTRRVGKTGLDHTHDPRLHGVVAGWSCHPGIHHRERTDELLAVTRWHGVADQMRPSGTWWQASRSSGNRAFDEYREETLRRLEEEQREFQDFLARLRMAKDKAEFDQFMAERRTRTDSSL